MSRKGIETPPPAAAALAHREVLRVLSGLMLGMLLAALDQTIVATALPTIARELNGLQHMSWVVSVYLLTSTATTPLYGKLSDIYGRRALLLTAIGVFLVASVCCALAQSMTQLILGRALQGLGGGGLISLAHITISDVIAPRDRGRYQGYFAAVFAAASVAGPVLGGLFSDHLGWRWVFWINLPIGVAALAISGVALKRLRTPRHAREIDYLGALLLITAVTALLLATSWGGVEYDWNSPVMIGLVVAGVALIAAFLLWEALTREPILPPRLFRNRVYATASLMAFLTAMALLGGTVFMPLFLQLASGETASQAGLMLIPFTGGTVVGSFVSGRIVSETGRYKIFPIVGLVVATLTFVFMARLGGEATPLLWGTLLLLLGTGIGMVLPITVVSIQNAIELNDLGAGTASISFFRSLGGSFGVALLGSALLNRLGNRIAALPGHELLGRHPALDLLRGNEVALAQLTPALREGLAQAAASSFALIFLMTAGMTALALVTALCLPELPLRTTTGMPAPPKPVEAPENTAL
jgi:EmrB/QacA subfamily drug resistance transporter